MMEHPVKGAEIIRHIGFLGDAALVVRSHHERWDGTGYPDGLAGEEIPLAARVFAVADVFASASRAEAFPYSIGEAMANRGAATMIKRRCWTMWSQKSSWS